MNKKIFDPKKYGMRTCPSCDSHGFVQNPERQCCSKCGGFGFIIKEAEQDAKHSEDRIES
jgi:DnaJ-class molecular chaperone